MVKVLGIPKRQHSLLAFANGSDTEEVFQCGVGEWEIISLSIDGANFGDGYTAFAEVYIDQSGLGAGSSPPLGNRICAMYFGGYKPLAWRGRARLRFGESIYVTLENTTGASVSALVELEVQRVEVGSRGGP